MKEKIKIYFNKFKTKKYRIPIKEFLLIERAKLKKISVADELKFQEKSVKIDGTFCELDYHFINLIMDIEKEFNIKINDNEISNIKTINQLKKIIKTKHEK